MINKLISCFIVFIVALGTSVQSMAANDPQASLQRGARVYMNYCAGCHSLKYLRYNRLASDLGLVSEDGQVDLVLLKNNLIFTQARPQDPIEVSLPAVDARQWFGVVPPDLSLIARQRSPEWIVGYLTGFYADPSRPFGVNNHLLPDVAMPNVLAPYSGESNEKKLNELVNDLVNFLVYVSEPIKKQRETTGFILLIFLFILLVFVYLLKRLYWQRLDFHNPDSQENKK